MAKKQLSRVVVTLLRDDERESEVLTITIPSGWKYKEGKFGDLDRLYNQDGKVAQSWEWKAGYTKHREYFYE
jgi:hypothetical protein